MLDINDFSKKQIVFYIPRAGDKLSYKNDNMVISNKDGEIKYQNTCYRIFMLVVVGDCTITTGLLRRAKKFGFAICLMSYGYHLYSTINAGIEGNTHLHEKQYAYSGIDIARRIVHNKVYNQRMLLQSFRKKSDDVKDAINMLKNYESQLETTSELHQILGIEGNSAKVYFSRVFNNTRWRGRKPRVKFDYINSLLDIAYTLLFNFIDCILQVYGFDVYKGVLHTQFYMRKSLVCDLMEPFRPIIDWRVRIGINLGQFKENDFVQIKDQWQLEYKKTAEYANVFMTDILDNKETIFLYIRSYYRAFMKGKPAKDFPFYDIHSREVKIPDDTYQL